MVNNAKYNYLVLSAHIFHENAIIFIKNVSARASQKLMNTEV